MDVESLFYRIDAGYIVFEPRPGLILYIKHPDKHIRYMAHRVFTKVYNEALMDGALEHEDMLAIMHAFDIWTEKMIHDWAIIPDNIENLKVSLYEASLNQNVRKKARDTLALTRERYNQLSSIKYSWDYLTAEGVANFAKWEYLIDRMIIWPDGTPYDWESITRTQALNFYQSNFIDEDKMRLLSRSEPWTSNWLSRKKNHKIFDDPMTDEQIRLVAWTSLYDNIRESSECPHDNIINDDDMLDGWLILQRRKREKEQNKKLGEEKISDKVSKSGEIFIPVGSAEDAKLVEEMNDMGAKMVKQKRNAYLQKHKHAHVMQLPDMKQKYMAAQNRAAANAIKGK